MRDKIAQVYCVKPEAGRSKPEQDEAFQTRSGGP